MIIQGSNLPLTIYEDEIDLTACTAIEVSLYHEDYGEVKHWSKSDMDVAKDGLICPLTQQETMSFPADEGHREKYYVDCKVMLDGKTRHFEIECVPVLWRENTTVMT